MLGSGATRWEVRYREAGRGSVRRARRFLLKADAEAFEREMLRRRQLGELAESDWAGRTVAELAEDWFGLYVIPNLEPRTQRDYARLLDRHVVPRLGSHRLREVRPEVVDRFRRELERQGTGRSQTRQALAVLQGMFRYAEERGRVRQNPVRLVRKPSGKRQRAVVALAPETVEAIRSTLIASGRLGDATLVSVLAYTGPRPQEALAIEWRHIRERTLLIEQKNVDGELRAGQKTVRPPRTVALIAPLHADLLEWRLALGSPRRGLVFPNQRGAPGTSTTGSLEPQGLDPGGAQCRCLRAALHAAPLLRVAPHPRGVSIPALAEELGHSPQMTLNTYGHVIRELRGAPPVSAEAQVLRARKRRGRAA